MMINMMMKSGDISDVYVAVMFSASVCMLSI